MHKSSQTLCGLRSHPFQIIALLILSVSTVLSTSQAGAQSVATEFVEVANGYSLTPNITYMRAGGEDLKLDLYRPRGVTGANPTLIYYHGGGWTNGNKESSALTFLPYLEMGWTVVNVEYRLADVAHAPAAVEDCRCALRWVYRNAERYGFDLDAIVVTGNSAGGHLALTTGMLPASAGMDSQCPGDRQRAWSTGSVSTAELKVAAIINWYGIADVESLMDGPPGSSGNFTEAWLGSASNRRETAKRVSPMNYVRPDLPPILTVHGSSDPTVPYAQSVRLHQALQEAGVTNELVTVTGGGHGGFSTPDMQRVFSSIRDFLQQQNL